MDSTQVAPPAGFEIDTTPELPAGFVPDAPKAVAAPVAPLPPGFVADQPDPVQSPTQTPAAKPSYSVPAEAAKAFGAGAAGAMAIPGQLIQARAENPFGSPASGAVDPMSQMLQMSDKLWRTVSPNLYGKPADFVKAKVSEFGKQVSGYWNELSKSGPLAQSPELASKSFGEAPVAKTVTTVAGAAPLYLAAIGLTAATKNPGLAAMLFGTAAKGQTYQQAREAGATPEAADAISALDAAWNTVSEGIPFQKMLGNAGASFITRTAKGFTTEAVQELFQQFGSNVIAKMGYDAGKKLTDNLIESFIGGGFLGSFGGALIHTATGGMQAPTGEPAPASPQIPESDRPMAESLASMGAPPETVTEWANAPTPEAKQAVLDAWADSVPAQPSDAQEAPPEAIPEPVTEIPATDDQPTLEAMRQRVATERGLDLPEGQFLTSAKPSDDRAADADAAERAAELIGKRVVWFKNADPAKVQFHGTVDDQNIYLDSNGKPSFVRTAMHEALHQVKTDAPDIYQQFLDVVKAEGSGFDAYRKKTLDAYAAQGMKVDEGDGWLWDEMAADAMGERGQDPGFWRDLYAKSPEAVKRIVDAIGQIVETMRGKVAGDPAIADLFTNFENVHKAAVDTLSQFAAARGAETQTQQAEVAQVAEAPAAQAKENEDTAIPGPSDVAVKKPWEIDRQDRVGGKYYGHDYSGEVRERRGLTTDSKQQVFTVDLDNPITVYGEQRKSVTITVPIETGETGMVSIAHRPDASPPAREPTAATAVTEPVPEKPATRTPEELAAKGVRKTAAPSLIAKMGMDELRKIAKSTKYDNGSSVWDSAGDRGTRKGLTDALAEHRKWYAAETGIAIRKQSWTPERRQAARERMIAMRNGDTDVQWQRIADQHQAVVDEALKSGAALPEGTPVFDADGHDWKITSVFAESGAREDKRGPTGRIMYMIDNGVEHRTVPASEVFAATDESDQSAIDTLGDTNDADKRAVQEAPQDRAGARPGVREAGDVAGRGDGQGGAGNERAVGQGEEVDDSLPFSIAQQEEGTRRSNVAERIGKIPAITPELKKWADNQSYKRATLGGAFETAHSWVASSGTLGRARDRLVSSIASDRDDLPPISIASAVEIVNAAFEQQIESAANASDRAILAERQEEFMTAATKMHATTPGQTSAGWMIPFTKALSSAYGARARMNTLLEESNKNAPGYEALKKEIEKASVAIDQIRREIARRVAETEAVQKVADRLRQSIKARDEATDKALAAASIPKPSPAALSSAMAKLGKLFPGGKAAAGALPMSIASESRSLTEAQAAGVDEATRAWIAQQKATGKPTDIGAWKSFMDEFAPGVTAFDNAADVYAIAKETLVAQAAGKKAAQRKVSRQETLARQAMEPTYSVPPETGKATVQGKIEGTGADKVTQARIKAALKELGTSLDAMIYDQMAREKTGADLIQRLVDSGLSKRDAATSALAIQAEINAMIGKRKADILTRKYGEKPEGKKRQSFDAMTKILRDMELGALSDAKIRDRFLEAHGLNFLTDEVRARIEDYRQGLAAVIKKYGGDEMAPEVLDAKQAMMKYMGQQVKMSKGERRSAVINAWMHFSTLSGFPTHVVNLLANFGQRRAVQALRAGQEIAKAMSSAASDPDAAKSHLAIAKLIYEAHGKAFGFAKASAEAAFAEGASPIKGSEKMDMDPARAGLLESDPYWSTGWRAPMKYVRRAMLAEDIMSYLPLEEMGTAQEIANVAMSEGLRGKALMNEVARRMGWSKADEFAADGKAKGLTGRDLMRYVHYEMTKMRPPDTRVNAGTFAAHETFNDPVPFGHLGILAHALQQAGSNSAALKALNMFVKTGANIANQVLDFSPYGYFRAMRGTMKVFDGHKFEPVSMESIYPGYKADVLSKANFFTATSAALAALAFMALRDWENDPDKDKKHPWFEIVGAGPKNPAEKQRWMAQGYKPYRMYVHGKAFANYGWLPPLAIAAELVGSASDWYRYNRKKGKDADEDFESFASAMTAATTKGMGQFIYESLPFASMNSVSKFFSNNNSADGFMADFAKFASSFTALAVPSGLTQFDKFFDPTVRRGTGLAVIMRNVPFARQLALEPALNVFGDEIRSRPTDRLFSQANDDEELMFLAVNNIGISPPEKNVIDPHTYQERPMTDHEWYEYMKIWGPMMRAEVRAIAPFMSKSERSDIRKQLAMSQARVTAQAQEAMMLKLHDSQSAKNAN